MLARVCAEGHSIGVTHTKFVIKAPKVRESIAPGEARGKK